MEKIGQKKSYQNIRQDGFIGITAPVVGLLALAASVVGVLIGSWTVKSGPLKHLSRAYGGGWSMEVISKEANPTAKKTRVFFHVSRGPLASGSETVVFFIRHEGDNDKYFEGRRETGSSAIKVSGFPVDKDDVIVDLKWTQTYIDEGCPEISGLGYGYSSNRLGKDLVNDNFTLEGLPPDQCPGAVLPTETPTPTPTLTPPPETTPTSTPTPTPTSTPTPTPTPACPTLSPPANVSIVFPEGGACFVPAGTSQAFLPQAVLTGGGDLNQDGVVNAADFSLFLKLVGTKQGESGYNNKADLNSDGVINALDGSLMLVKLGQ